MLESSTPLHVPPLNSLTIGVTYTMRSAGNPHGSSASSPPLSASTSTSTGRTPLTPARLSYSVVAPLPAYRCPDGSLPAATEVHNVRSSSTTPMTRATALAAARSSATAASVTNSVIRSIFSTDVVSVLENSNAANMPTAGLATSSSSAAAVDPAAVASSVAPTLTIAYALKLVPPALFSALTAGAHRVKSSSRPIIRQSAIEYDAPSPSPAYMHSAAPGTALVPDTASAATSPNASPLLYVVCPSNPPSEESLGKPSVCAPPSDASTVSDVQVTAVPSAVVALAAVSDTSTSDHPLCASAALSNPHKLSATPDTWYGSLLTRRHNTLLSAPQADDSVRALSPAMLAGTAS